MKNTALILAIATGVALAHGKGPETKPVDPCGSPPEFFSKQMLDRCYKGYFDAIVESKRLAEEANKKAEEASRKMRDVEGRVKKLEDIADDHEKRIRALEARPTQPAVTKEKEGAGPQKLQVEELGVVYFPFNKFHITSSEAKRLNELADKLKRDDREILVVGFADTKGTSRYNFNLSTWRAQMVASQLVKRGVDVSRIRVVAYGKEVADMLGSKHAQQRAVKIYIAR
ncbi:MAG: OmpA family protein [Aquificaceae bacterium]|nr:OmpA family protein [Aquificaceae bacterium]